MVNPLSRHVQSGAYTQYPKPALPRCNVGDKTVPDQQGPTVPSRLYTIWLTTINDGAGYTDHAVPDDEMVTAQGVYTAICGSMVYPAVLDTPPGWRCVRCATTLETRKLRHKQRRPGPGHRRPGWLARFIRWCQY